jgi:hypothetical protein
VLKKQLDVRFTATTIECFHKDERVASHLRSAIKGRHTTLTGQLALLMLIERISDKAISANTDGITLHYDKQDEAEVQAAVQWWENLTGFNMEWRTTKPCTVGTLTTTSP